MTIVGDPKAYALLRNHPQLMRPLEGRLVATLAGRLFALTFLLFTDFLTKDAMNEWAAKYPDVDASWVAVGTGTLIRQAAERWKAVNLSNIENYPGTIVFPTDVTYAQMTQLLQSLIDSQAQLEDHAKQFLQ